MDLAQILLGLPAGLATVALFIALGLYARAWRIRQTDISDSAEKSWNTYTTQAAEPAVLIPTGDVTDRTVPPPTVSPAGPQGTPQPGSEAPLPQYRAPYGNTGSPPPIAGTGGYRRRKARPARPRPAGAGAAEPADRSSSADDEQFPFGPPVLPPWLSVAEEVKAPLEWQAARPQASPTRRLRISSNIEKNQAREYFEHIRNAKKESYIYFWTCLATGLCGLIVLLIAAYLSIFNRADHAIFTAICGSLPAATSVLFYTRADAAAKAAAANLDLLNKSVQQTEQRKIAIEIALALPDGTEQRRILSMVAMRQLFPSESAAELTALLTTEPNQVASLSNS